MQAALSHTISGRRTEHPAAVLSGLTVSTPDGRPHSRRWDGLIDTGSDFSVLPNAIVEDLRLTTYGELVRVRGYRKDERPRELAIYRVKLGLPLGLIITTKAITAERRNILIGRSALQQMRLTIDWPANWWSLEEVTLPKVPPPR